MSDCLHCGIHEMLESHPPSTSQSYVRREDLCRRWLPSARVRWSNVAQSVVEIDAIVVRDALRDIGSPCAGVRGRYVSAPLRLRPVWLHPVCEIVRAAWLPPVILFHSPPPSSLCFTNRI
jgi:hypothetical protein